MGLGRFVDSAARRAIDQDRLTAGAGRHQRLEVELSLDRCVDHEGLMPVVVLGLSGSSFLVAVNALLLKRLRLPASGGVEGGGRASSPDSTRRAAPEHPRSLATPSQAIPTTPTGPPEGPHHGH